MGQPRPILLFIFGLFKQTYVKNVHPLNGAGIWTHNLQNMSLLP